MQTKAELEDHLQWCHNCYVVCNTTKMTIGFTGSIFTNCQTIFAAACVPQLSANARATGRQTDNRLIPCIQLLPASWHQAPLSFPIPIEPFHPRPNLTS